MNRVKIFVIFFFHCTELIAELAEDLGHGRHADAEFGMKRKNDKG